MKKKKVRVLSLFSGIACCVILIGGEIYLREEWGFCDAVLLQRDPDFEYIAQPDQERNRFKKQTLYNEYSQRNGPVDSTAYVILGLGDSVINGGVMTDQDSLATTLLSDRLAMNGSPVQVLNISAGSWGPDNCMAYLERYGTFGASMAFLVCSSHDAHDIMEFESVVDVHPGFSSTQYGSAWLELVDRYAWPRIKDGFMAHFSHRKEAPSQQEEAPVLEIHKSGKGFNSGFGKLAAYFKERQIPFLIYLHAETSEQKQGRYNKEGEEILSFCKKYGVAVKTDLGVLTDADYRDHIHLSEQGQYRLYEALKLFLSSTGGAVIK